MERTAQSILASVQVGGGPHRTSRGSNTKRSRTKKGAQPSRLVSAGESSFARKNAKRYTQARVSKQRTGVGGTALYKLSPGPEERRHLKLSPAASLEKYEPLASPIQETKNEGAGFWSRCFPTETSRPAHCLAFDFCHLLYWTDDPFCPPGRTTATATATATSMAPGDGPCAGAES